MEFNNIKDFKSNFSKIYHSEVVPQLELFDKERQSTRKKAVTFAAIGLLAGVAIFLFFNNTPNDIFMFAGGVLMFFGLIVYPLMQKGFEHKLKERILPVLMKAFGNFQWSTMDTIDTSEIVTSRLFSGFEHRDSDDNFIGTYNNMPIAISETELYYYTSGSRGNRQKHTTFKGVIITIGVGKNFTGHTIIRVKGLFGARRTYEEVKLEDPEFDKKFFVDSNDQVEARFLITPAFMERFKRISNAFGAKHAECSFKDGKVMIALATMKDLFKLGSLNTPLTDTKPYEVFLNEILSILEMIDHLKVTQKIGL